MKVQHHSQTVPTHVHMLSATETIIDRIIMMLVLGYTICAQLGRLPYFYLYKKQRIVVMCSLLSCIKKTLT